MPKSPKSAEAKKHRIRFFQESRRRELKECADLICSICMNDPAQADSFPDSSLATACSNAALGCATPEEAAQIQRWFELHY